MNKINHKLTRSQVVLLADELHLSDAILAR